MTLAMVNVLPLPVTPRSVWCFRPPRSPSTSLSTAGGWSPVLWDSAAGRHRRAAEVEDFYRQIGAGRTLIHYDMRGTGLSERGVEDLSLDATVSDMQAV